MLVQIVDGFREVLRGLVVVAHHALNGGYDVRTRIDAVFVVVRQCILLHVLGRQLSPVALLAVGEIQRLVAPCLVEGAFVASLLGSLLQPVRHIHEGLLVVFVVETVHLLLQLLNVVSRHHLSPGNTLAYRQKQREK